MKKKVEFFCYVCFSVYVVILLFVNNLRLQKKIKIISISFCKKLKEERSKNVIDNLTNMYKVDRLFSHLDYLISKNKEFTLCFIDLDDFKIINDTYGHNIGNIYLQHFANMLLNISSNMIGYRFGGDEFVMVIIGNKDKGNEIISKIEDLKKEKISIVDKENGNIVKISICFSIGYASSDETKNLHELVDMADKRMYVMKQKVKGII